MSDCSNDFHPYFTSKCWTDWANMLVIQQVEMDTVRKQRGSVQDCHTGCVTIATVNSASLKARVYNTNFQRQRLQTEEI